MYINCCWYGYRIFNRIFIRVSTTTSGNTSGGYRKGGGTGEWIKNKLKALSQLLGKLADKVLAALPGIIGLILS